MQKAILLTSYGFVAQPGLPDEDFVSRKLIYRSKKCRKCFIELFGVGLVGIDFSAWNAKSHTPNVVWLCCPTRPRTWSLPGQTGMCCLLHYRAIIMRKDKKRFQFLGLLPEFLLILIKDSFYNETPYLKTKTNLILDTCNLQPAAGKPND